MGINALSFNHSENGFTPKGLGFAIPTELATKIMEKLIRDGRVIRGFIGITARDLPRIRSNNNDIKQIKGLRIFQVSVNAQAENAGIQVGDIIISVNHQPVISAAETMDQVAEISPGSIVPVTVLCNEKTMTVHVKIEEYNEGKSLLQ